MKFTAIVATDNVDRNGEKYSLEALASMIPKKGTPVLRNFSTDNIVGYVESAVLDGNRLFVTFEGTDLDDLYAVPGFKIVKTHNEGDTTIYDAVEIKAFGLVDKRPADLDLTPLRLVNKYPTLLRYEALVDDAVYKFATLEDMYTFSLKLLNEFYEAGKYNIGELPKDADGWLTERYQKDKLFLLMVLAAIDLQDGFKAFKCLTLTDSGFFPKMYTRTIYVESEYNLDWRKSNGK